MTDVPVAPSGVPDRGDGIGVIGNSRTQGDSHAVSVSTSEAQAMARKNTARKNCAVKSATRTCVYRAQTKNSTSPIAAAATSTGSWTSRPARSPAAPAVFRVPIGKDSQDSGTPAFTMPGRIGCQCRRAAIPEKALMATVTATTTTAVLVISVHLHVRELVRVGDRVDARDLVAL